MSLSPKGSCILIMSVFVCLFVHPASVSGWKISDEERMINEIYKDNLGALVLIENHSRDLQGSGLIYSSDGKIITNYHVIHEGLSLEVWVKGKVLSFKEVYILGVDTDRDLAIIRVDARDLPTVRLARLGRTDRRYDDVSVGMRVLAFGNPLTLPGSLTDGRISHVRKSELVTGIDFHEGYEVFQISAHTAPGSSGGALLNMEGEVVGITVAGLAPGFNFAIPINFADPLIREAGTSQEIRSQDYPFPIVARDPYYLQASSTREQRNIVGFTRISGNTLDKRTLELLSSVDVFITGMRMFDTTDTRGLFELDIPWEKERSEFTLYFEKQRYKTREMKIDVGQPPDRLRGLRIFLEKRFSWMPLAISAASVGVSAYVRDRYCEADEDYREILGRDSIGYAEMQRKKDARKNWERGLYVAYGLALAAVSWAGYDLWDFAN